MSMRPISHIEEPSAKICGQSTDSGAENKADDDLATALNRRH